jgi:hypothetical protein
MYLSNYFLNISSFIEIKPQEKETTRHHDTRVDSEAPAVLCCVLLCCGPLPCI